MTTGSKRSVEREITNRITNANNITPHAIYFNKQLISTTKIYKTIMTTVLSKVANHTLTDKVRNKIQAM